jgi:hypothetical protein
MREKRCLPNACHALATDRKKPAASFPQSAIVKA